MGFWEDLGVAAGGFSRGIESGQEFRMKRETAMMRREEMDARKRELEDEILRKKREAEINARLIEMSNRIRERLRNPLVWEVKNGKASLRPEFVPDLINQTIEMQSIAETPTQISRVNLIGDFMKSAMPVAEKPKEYEPSQLEKTVGFLKSQGIQLTPDEMKHLAKVGTDTEEDITPDEAVDYYNKAKAKYGLEGVTTIFKDKKLVAAGIKKARELEQKNTEASVDLRRNMEEGGEPRPSVLSIPAIQPTPTAPITEPSPQDEETDVKTKILDLHKGGKPFPTFKVGQQYFQDARSRGHLDQNNYVKVYRLLQTNYPDTTK